MKKKYIIIIITIIIALIALVVAYSSFNKPVQISEHTTLILSDSAYMEVPKNPNASNNVDKKGIFYYADITDSINVTSCSNLSEQDSASQINQKKNLIERGSKKIIGETLVIYLKDGIYSIFIKNTQYNDTILIQSTNKNLLIQCWETIKFHSPTDKLKFDTKPSDSKTGTEDSNSVVNVAEKTKSTVKKSNTKSTTKSNTKSTTKSSSSYSSSSNLDTIGHSSYNTKKKSKSSKKIKLNTPKAADV